jgi:exopolysaccharide biosynthesis protein
VAWSEIAQPKLITVGINTKLATTSAALAEAYDCSILTNATFYDKSGNPMGLLISNGVELSPWKKNQLFNGVIGFDIEGKRVVLEIGEPTKSYQWAIQAGPVLWSEGESVTYDRSTDQAARRIVLILTDHSELYVGVVTAADSLFSGPTLQQMNGVLSAWEQQSGKRFKAVLNLDGGTASAYLSPTLKLKELKSIGSFLCAK